MIQKRLAILIAFAVVAGAVVYFAAQERGPIGEMRVQALAGSITLQRDGVNQTVSDEIAIEPGDTIRTSSDGLAKLRLNDDRLAWLSRGTRVGIVGTDSLDIQSGRLLGHARDALHVEFDGVTALANDSTFRIDQGVGSSRAAAYRGGIELAAPGQPRLFLSSLFEAAISAGRLPRDTRPLQIQESDWDLDSVPRDEVPALGYLEEILELDQTLTQRGNGLETQLGNERPRLPYFRDLAGRKVGFMRPMLKRPVKDLLIGFTIAKNSSGSLKKDVRRTFRLRDEGGIWGVVAAIQEAKPKVLISELGSLIVAATRVGGGAGSGVGEASFTLAAGSPGSSAGSTGGSTGGTTNNTGGSGGGGGGGGDGGGGDDECDASAPECTIEEVSKQLPNPDPTPTEDPPLLDL